MIRKNKYQGLILSYGLLNTALFMVALERRLFPFAALYLSLPFCPLRDTVPKCNRIARCSVSCRVRDVNANDVPAAYHSNIGTGERTRVSCQQAFPCVADLEHDSRHI